MLCAALAAAGTAAATVPAAAPSAEQVRAAIGRATHSRGLWATLNICNTRRHRNTVGIRAQMPALSFPATLQMQFSLDYYSPRSSPDFQPLPGTRTRVRIGTVAGGFHQEGMTFVVRPPAILQGSVEFTWRSGGRVLGRIVRATTTGHRGAQQGDPKGYSAATCRLGA